jgi:arylsulfatase A-like enzyme
MRSKWFVLGAYLVVLVACSVTPTPPAPLSSATTVPPSVVPSATAPMATGFPTETSQATNATLMATVTAEPIAELAPTATRTPLPLSGPPQTILLIFLDSLRAGHVSAYGYEQLTTPNLDAWIAAEGVRFTDVTSTAPWTCPSVASMLTGRTPTSLGTTFATMTKSLPQDANTLAEYLQTAGYYTAGFATTYCVKGKIGFSQGFDHYDDELSSRPGSDKATAGMVNARAMAWLEKKWLPKQSTAQPLFLFLYYFDAHVFYDPPSPYDSLFDPAYTGTFDAETFGNGDRVIKGELVPARRDIQHLVALYDGEINYWDAQLGQMLAYMQVHGLLENALIVVTADHGEQFGEHGLWVHTNSVYEELLRIPLLMRYTGALPAKAVVTSPVQSFDIMPTILDWAGLPLPGDIQAISLRGLALGDPAGPARSVYGEVDGLRDEGHPLYSHASRYSQRSIRRAGWKLIHYLEDPSLDQLYDLTGETAWELENLLAAEPERAGELLGELLAWFGLRR